MGHVPLALLLLCFLACSIDGLSLPMPLGSGSGEESFLPRQPSLPQAECEYGNWSEWIPVSFGTQSSGIGCPKYIEYERTTERLPDEGYCNGVSRKVETNRTCLPSPQEQLEMLKQAFDTEFDGVNPPDTRPRYEVPQAPRQAPPPQNNPIAQGQHPPLVAPGYSLSAPGPAPGLVAGPPVLPYAPGPRARIIHPQRPAPPAQFPPRLQSPPHFYPSLGSGAVPYRSRIDDHSEEEDTDPEPPSDSITPEVDELPSPDDLQEDPKDIAIVIDASGSVRRNNYERAVQNIATLMGLMCYKWKGPGQPSDIRLALIIYSTNVQIVFNFTRSTEIHISAEAIRDSFMAAQRLWWVMGGSTATAPALERCKSHIFQHKFGMRTESKKRLILLTDGYSNRGGPPTPYAEKLHDDVGVDIFPIGIGTGVNLRELHSMKLIQDKNNLLSRLLILPDFASLARIVEEVSRDTATKQFCQSKLLRK
ncbi:uncharacterized protein LOC135811685 [Sycon ciliatum]|uniref:uncharacterized protein LOC135811685 n=1 Tax=Sycon ciliatum TaxID=27933 RepID=UPI0031F5F6E1